MGRRLSSSRALSLHPKFMFLFFPCNDYDNNQGGGTLLQLCSVRSGGGVPQESKTDDSIVCL